MSGRFERNKRAIERYVTYNMVDKRMPRRCYNTPGLDRALRRCPVSKVYHQPSLFDELRKVCHGCNLLKPLSEYGKCKAVKSGLRGRCKVCEVEAQREYVSRNTEKVREKQKRYREENREALYAQRREWYKQNREYVLRKAREYYQENKEACLERGEQFRQNNPDYWKVYQPQWVEKNRELAYHHNRQRRARKLAAPGSHTAQEWLDLCELYEHTCLACGATDSQLTRDHIIPLIAGGSNDISNLQPLCSPCNSRKGVLIIDYREERRIGPV